MNAFVKSRRELVTINMRVDSHQKAFIDAAVNILGTDRTRFVIESALREAEKVLLDRRVYTLDESSFKNFENALDKN